MTYFRPLSGADPHLKQPFPLVGARAVPVQSQQLPALFLKLFQGLVGAALRMRAL